MKIADTHTHLYFSAFDKDQKQVIDKCRKAGVELQIQIGCDEISSLAALKLAKENDDFYSTLGIHPCDVKVCFDENKLHRSSGFENYRLKAKTFDELFTMFEKLIKENPKQVVGFGETGFDLYHENSEEIFKIQTEVFKAHVRLAQKYNKPLIVHGRNSSQQMIDFFTQNIQPGEVSGVIHCFPEGPEYANFFTKKYGFFIGIGGTATYPKADNIREAIATTPIEYLVTETDAPFLVPQSLRKTVKRNDASLLPEVIKLIADIKNLPVEETAEILFENAKRLYQLGSGS
jgi:TatD DNase family protein